ncbi:histidine kinase [Roseisolibacter sp. H3M3-2]|uniref:sensor histidine kinase n=1 Tax=Roseisolibacter sp. H3M3-2 TaxID=3031323 RepID=UPI0023DA7E3F|nr:histidine kinase [Roseisolibacter sp. H3M3-2]MDF1503187.1 histidine kinase [Roseisolibacter sp. H3M3-2]
MSTTVAPTLAPAFAAGAPARLLARVRGPAIAAAVWLSLVPLFALQHAVAVHEAGRPVEWGRIFAVTLDQFLVCLPMLPLLGLLVRRAPLQEGRVVRNGALLLAGIFAVALVRDFVVAPAVLPVFADRAAPQRRMANVFADATVYLWVVLALHARLYWRRLRAQEVEGARLAQRLAETQLMALRAQLQPHFLFNTLNAISALIRDEPEVADRMLTRLADLLRAVLEPPPGDEHALSDELTVLERYLEIMGLRFGPRLAVEISVAPDVRHARVPWLVLQPLVENALEHGAGARRGPVRVRVTASRGVSADGADALLLAVCDDGPGPRASQPGPRRGTGIGLDNTRRRLAQLHGERASLVLEALPEGGACARLTLPWREVPARAAVAA